MPRGAKHTETGTLRRLRIGYALDMDGGGCWRLDIDRSVKRLIGKRVTVEGTRAGFDLLDVANVWVAGENRPVRLGAHISSLFRIKR